MIRSPPETIGKSMSTTRSERRERRAARSEALSQAAAAPEKKPEVASKGVKSRSSAASNSAQKKKLELEAAEEKARIQLDLIDKRLAADLAAVDSYSPAPSLEDGNSRDEEVKKWLNHSQQHILETQKAHNDGKKRDSLRTPPPDPDGTEGPVQQLASAIKELITTSATPNQNLLSRMSTPRDLPIFFGDPMDWLAFKQAYEESTSLCNFTDKENIWRLRKCLRGPAKEAVAALIITATSAKIVMSTLELQFGNPDIIISKIMTDIKKIPTLSQDYHRDIVPFSIKIQNYVAAVRALNREEYLQGVSVVNLVLTKLPTVLLSKWADYSYPLIISGNKTRMDILSEFLSDEAVKISTCSAHLLQYKTDKRKYNESGYPQTQTILLQTNEKTINDKCRFCHGSTKHMLPDCKKFKKSLRKERWAYVKRAGICYKCLVSRHDRRACPAPACGVDACGEAHHQLLHYVPKARCSEMAAVQLVDCTHSNAADDVSQANDNSEVITHIKSSGRSVILQVVKVNIHGPRGVTSATALLDSGSTVTLISATLAARVQLRGRKQILRARGAWDDAGLEFESELVDLILSSKTGTAYTICARSVNELNLPVQNLSNINYEKYTYLSDLREEFCNGRLRPEILIGQDNYHLMLPLETVAGKLDEPCATRTPLGWCLHGRVASSLADHHSTLLITDDMSAADDLKDLHEEVRRSFSIEAMGVSASKPRENSEDRRAWDHLEATSELADGKWLVGLPWKNNNCFMPDTYAHALARLKGVELKMKRNKDYAEKYEERVQHLLDNDYAEELKEPNNKTPKTWYLPHFGIENPHKKRIRLVFDAASKVEGLSLNDYLLKGPDLLMSLFGIMLRFREHRVAVVADIKDMFLRVKIRPEDRDSLRFVYRHHSSEDDNTMNNTPTQNETSLKTYVMSSLIFGANCSPFIAQFIKNKNARRFESTMQSAAHAIYKQHYMDDYIDSLPDEATAISIIKEIMYIHSQGNFELRNWNSNSLTVLDSIQKETLGSTAVKFKIGQQYEGERTLGLLWYPSEDSLGFETSFKRIPDNIINGKQRPTKREMLRVVMSIFDVYGFLSPFTIIGKIILQDTWRQKIDWDECVNDEIYDRWQRWICLLHSIKHIRFPRYYASATRRENETESQSPKTGQLPVSHSCDHATQCATKPPRDVASPTHIGSATPHLSVTGSAQLAVDGGSALSNNSLYNRLQLHIFCDSSTKAYCAVAYWRWINSDNTVSVAFVSSRSRVAGNKVITVPRLELQAALLGARLADTILKEHKMNAEQRIFWSDSTTALHWIRNDARNYKIYIANRLGEIDELTKMSEWRYVPKTMNVADIATRETYDCSIFYKEWLNGPTFLRSQEEDWPHDIIEKNIDTTILECITTIQTEQVNLPVPEPTRFSSWLRLLRTTNRVIIFINNGMKALRKRFKEREYTYQYDDSGLEKAEALLIRHSQNESFGAEIALLKGKRQIPTASRLLTLSPYLDEHGVLRAAGRIDAAAGILPETKRPVILDGREYIARLIVRHYHIQAAHGNQEMVVNNLKQKYWIIRIRPTVKNVVSKCMMCRLRKAKPEIPRIGDLPEARLAHHQRPFTYCGTDLFGPMEITMGRRRERRYGVIFTCLTVRAIHIEIVSTLTTDSFIMALRRMASRRGWPNQIFSDNGTNLRGADAELKKSILELNQHAMSEEAKNYGVKWTFIPPVSPHWGGAWERLIRSIKTSLKAVLRERAPREETLMTLLAEVENIINSRPLSHVSVELGSVEALTPNHFLLGSASSLPQIGSFDDSDLFLRKQWRVAQRLADMYWRRWVKEVLPQMIPRQRWCKEQQPIRTGDLVIIVDPDSPRNLWRRGVVAEVYPGKDGRVRMVQVKTQTGFLTRSVTRVARVPIESECC